MQAVREREDRARPDEDRPYAQGKRRADALVALCSGPHPARARVFLHVAPGEEGGELEGGGVAGAETGGAAAVPGHPPSPLGGPGWDPLRVGRGRRFPLPGSCATSAAGTGSAGSPAAGPARSGWPTTWGGGGGGRDRPL
ncbi:MAG TPA: hypothetical protein VNO34_10455 [Actinomycetota bacterium]|nr:hypothetical protein [Actinomycetota bacterium]